MIYLTYLVRHPGIFISSILMIIERCIFDKADKVPLVHLLSSVVGRSEVAIDPRPESTVDARIASTVGVRLEPSFGSSCLIGRRFRSIRLLYLQYMIT